MPGYVDVFVVGDSAGVLAMLAHLEQKLLPTNIAVFLQTRIDPYLRVRASERFQGEGDDVVGQWAPLLPATQAMRSAQGYGSDHPINRRTGELEDYIVHSGGGITIHPAGATLTFPGTPAGGNLADKVRTAQAGSSNPVTVPRPVLGMNERDLAAVLTALALDIQRP